MVKGWMTAEEVEKEFNLDLTSVVAYWHSGFVRTRDNGTRRLFSRTDLERQLADETLVRLGMDEEWVDYSKLFHFHKIKLGWLDALVCAGRVKKSSQGLYLYHQVLEALIEDPEQRKMDRKQWGWTWTGRV